MVPAGTKIHIEVADALERQNRAWGASEATLKNIQRLREGAHAVVTGQQVGLFGGPLLALLKVASVLALAKQVESAGVPCVPVFWMATEDHDLAEVNQTLLLGNDFELAAFSAPAEGIADSPVASVRFAAGTDELVRQAAEMLGDSVVADCLRDLHAGLRSLKFLGSYPVAGPAGAAIREEADQSRRDARAWMEGLRGEITTGGA